MMADIDTIIVVVILIASSAFVLNSRLKINEFGVWEYMCRNGIGNYEENCKALEKMINNNKYCSWFFFLTGELIWCSLIVLMILQKLPMPSMLSKILGTGIHVPFIFLMCGRIIKELQKKLLKRWKISEEEIRQSIWLITVCLDLFLFILNWEMALFVAAILLGKYVWLDTSIDTLRLQDYWDGAWKHYTFKELDEEKTGVAILFSKIMLFLSVISIIGSIFYNFVIRTMP